MAIFKEEPIFCARCVFQIIFTYKNSLNGDRSSKTKKDKYT